MTDDLRERAIQYAIQSAGAHSTPEDVLRAAQMYADFIAGTKDGAILDAAKRFAVEVAA